jgi:predicted DNA-binding mobile mystery protein A
MGIKSARSRRLEVARLDRYFRQLTNFEGAQVSQPSIGWVKTIRQALGMSVVQLARRLGISRTSVYKIEKREIERSITIAQLDRVAEALDCHLSYSLVPNISIEAKIRKRALIKAEAELRSANQSMALEAEGLMDEDLLGSIATSSSYTEALADRKLWDD